MSLVVDVSVFIDKLFIYDDECSARARNVSKLLGRKGLNILSPKCLGRARLTIGSDKAQRCSEKVVQ